MIIRCPMSDTKITMRLASVLLLIFCFTTVQAQQQPSAEQALDQETFRVGAMLSAIASASFKDVEIGTKLIVDEVMKEIGADVTMEIYTDLSEFNADLEAGRLDLVIGTPQNVLSYLKVEENPVFYTFEADGKSTHQFVLISRKSSGIDSLSDIQNKDIVMFHGSDAGKLYLNAKLKTDGLPELDSFVRSITHVRGHPDAINRVFFGQADVGFVTSRALELARELNPQVAQELQPLLESPELLTLLVIPVSKKGVRSEFEPILFSLHESPKGRTLMNVFQCDRMTYGDVKDLNLIKSLIDVVNGESIDSNPLSVLKN